MSTELSERKRSTSFFLTLAALVLITFLSPNFERLLPYPEAILNLVLCAAASAWLFDKAPVWCGAVAVILPFLRGLYLTASPLRALSFLLYLPIGLCYALVSRKKLSRSAAANLSGGFLSVAVIGVLAAAVIRRTGSFSVDAILEAFPSVFNVFRNVLSTTLTVTIAGKELSYVTSANVHAYYEMILAITPGIIVMSCLLIAYASGYVYRILLTAIGDELPDASVWKLTPALSTVLYFLAALLLSLLSVLPPLVTATATNLLLILGPGLILAGIGSVFEVRVINGLERPRLLRPALLLLCLFSGIELLIGLLISFACLDTIKAALFRKKLKK